MKPWLFDILACPIDKYFPLKLYIFSFENKLEEFQSIINSYENRDIKSIKNEDVIHISHEKGAYFVKDNIIIEKTKLPVYLNLILSSINEFKNIFDKSPNEFSKKCFEIIKSEVKSNIMKFSEKVNLNELESILPELHFINKIKLDLEIESGILFCDECKRWYPIIETIPQMLPDKYRKEEQEIEFLKTNKNLLSERFFHQDLKPFNI
jgi:uncharacterized protein YbaR (Trm112 family)